MTTPRNYVPLARDPLGLRAARVVRALLVGAAATLGDVLVLTFCLRVLQLEPSIARAPALMAGALVQFLGNRTFTFRASAGDLRRHARLFLLFESSAYLANLFLYHYLVKWIRFLPAEVTSFVGTFVIFAGYSYPIRRWVVFRLLHSEQATVAGVEQGAQAPRATR